VIRRRPWCDGPIRKGCRPLPSSGLALRPRAGLDRRQGSGDGQVIGRVLGEVTKEVPGATEGDGMAALRQWLQHQVIPIGDCRSVLPCGNTEQILVGEGQAEGRCGTPPYRSGTGPEVVICRVQRYGLSVDGGEQLR
jgi:hypothetical protein